MPAIDDGGVLVFYSNAILLYLAEKTGKFLPANTPQPTAPPTLSWLMFVATGVGPYSGQAVHFKHFAPKDQNHDYSHNRYQFEAQRHYKVLDDHLAGEIHDRRHLHHRRHGALGLGAAGRLRDRRRRRAKYPNVKRLVDEISARPAAAKAIALKDKFTFKAEMDDEARGNMFTPPKARWRDRTTRKNCRVGKRRPCPPPSFLIQLALSKAWWARFRFADPQANRRLAAIASISTSHPGRASRLTTTSVLAGGFAVST